MSNILYVAKYVATNNDSDKSFMDQVTELTQNARKRQTEIMQRKLEREFDIKNSAVKRLEKTNQPAKKSINKKV